MNRTTIIIAGIEEVGPYLLIRTPPTTHQIDSNKIHMEKSAMLFLKGEGILKLKKTIRNGMIKKTEGDASITNGIK
jgi:hypothetical protein